MPNSSSVPTVFLQFFTWTALHDVDSPFSLILGTKTTAVEGGTSSPKCYDLYTTDGVKGTSVSVILQHSTCMLNHVT